MSPFALLFVILATIFNGSVCHVKGQCDNQSVLANTTNPDSTLKKKSQSIAYHFIGEDTSRNEWRTTYIKTHDNEADLLTKQLPSRIGASFVISSTTSFVRNVWWWFVEVDYSRPRMA